MLWQTLSRNSANMISQIGSEEVEERARLVYIKYQISTAHFFFFSENIPSGNVLRYKQTEPSVSLRHQGLYFFLSFTLQQENNKTEILKKRQI